MLFESLSAHRKSSHSRGFFSEWSGVPTGGCYSSPLAPTENPRTAEDFFLSGQGSHWGMLFESLSAHRKSSHSQGFFSEWSGVPIGGCYLSPLVPTENPRTAKDFFLSGQGSHWGMLFESLSAHRKSSHSRGFFSEWSGVPIGGCYLSPLAPTEASRIAGLFCKENG
jgi:hypothetical protein